ncbi:translation initiation factor IF-2 [Candidatus Parcubacteria bacterium]|nr:MAG: translation initiation factor IF-2 [Candidatus Parcubacteria bacterium]
MRFNITNMNITALARLLKISPQELREQLPKLGFDIGQKAIKIPKPIANKIIKDWPRLRRQIETQKRIEKEQQEAEMKEKLKADKVTVKLPKLITVRELSDISNIPVNRILAELMKNGIFASLNEKIDYDTAWLISEDLGLDILPEGDDTEEPEEKEQDKLKEAIKDQKDSLQSRAPVVVVMGHVDHGKTRLLDAIRETNVIEGEAGGITQHIGAYQIEKNNKKITFIDTPGHEAFTAMRSRGAKIADIAILVVAADDGVKPQTVEAYRILEKAKLPVIVAINKIDKPEANIDKTKQELSSQLKLIPEDWGGKTIMAPISAKAGTGIDELIDTLLLLADVESENIQANPGGQPLGSVIESNIDKGAGPVVTLLVQNGVFKTGDSLSYNGIDYGKVRALYNYLGEKIDEAGPSMPAKIIGLKISPEVGDLLEVGEGRKLKTKKIKGLDQGSSLQSQSSQEEDESVKRFTILIKSDVLGSAEAIEESLLKVQGSKIKVKIIHKGLGNITEGDVSRAEAAGAMIAGFNVKIPTGLEEIVREKGVEVKMYNVIYDLINDVKEKLESMIDEEVIVTDLGKLKVLAIFRTEAKKQIVGGSVLEGKIEKDTIIDIERKGKIIDRGVLVNLQSGKQEVDYVSEGEECGLVYEGEPVIEEGDILIIKKQETIKSSL